jgi:hypothetical protein
MLFVSAGVLAGCAASPPAASQAQGQMPAASSTQLPTPVIVRDLHPSPDRPGTIVGEWTADISTRGARAPVQLTVNRQEDKTAVSDAFWRSDTPIDGLPAAGAPGAVHFGLARAAGTLTFDGTSDGKAAQGIARFEADAAYASEIQTTYGQVSPDRLFELALAGYDLTYAKALYQAGYRFTLSDALALYLAEIPADYAVDLHRAGYELTFADILHLHHAGLLASYVAELHLGGYQLSVDDLILLAHSGIAADYAVAMRKAGVATSVSDLVYLQHADVSADYARQFASAGYHFTAGDIVKLRIASIGGEYAIAMRKAGYTLSAEDLVRLAKASVDADYASAVIEGGHENLSADDLIQLKQKGIDAEMLRRLRK